MAIHHGTKSPERYRESNHRCSICGVRGKRVLSRKPRTSCSTTISVGHQSEVRRQSRPGASGAGDTELSSAAAVVWSSRATATRRSNLWPLLPFSLTVQAPCRDLCVPVAVSKPRRNAIGSSLGGACRCRYTASTRAGARKTGLCAGVPGSAESSFTDQSSSGHWPVSFLILIARSVKSAAVARKTSLCLSAWSMDISPL